MATEYKLSYTASEIDEKLGTVDTLTVEVGNLDKSLIQISDNLSQTNERIDAFEEATDPYTDYQPDVPENIGVLNTILNFKQIAEISIKPKATIPHATGDWKPVATPYYGLPYSSSRVEEGFVPNFVSLYTFMTALQNPNSYLYTVDLGELGNQNGDTYYGSVCSVACEYALNIEPNYTTHQWQDIPGMEMLPWQSVYALKLGDTICHHTSGHVVMVTDITRNKRGRIGTITISEACNPRVKHNEPVTPERLAELYPTKDYGYFRYSKIHEVQHIQSPFVAVEDELPQDFTYNTALIPRKGDKANWLAGVPVEIDLMSKSDYTSVEIYKDDVFLESVNIDGGTEQSVDRSIYGVSWSKGSTYDSNQTYIHSDQFITSFDVNIVVEEGVKANIAFSSASQSVIGYSDWIVGPASVLVSDLAIDNAKMFRINVRLNDESEITNVDTVVSMIDLKIPNDVNSMPIVFGTGTLQSATGAEADNINRARSDFLPLQNVQIECSDSVQYYLYYYDANKTYLSNSGGWLSGSINVMDVAPLSAAYYRIVIKNLAGSSIITSVGTHSLEITSTIIGGAVDGALDVVVLDDLGYGSYKARMTNGTEYSDWCYWIVVDAVSTAVSTGNGREVSVTFSASNAEPLFVKWAGGKDNGTKHISVLSDEEKTDGTAVCTYDMGNIDDGQSGQYKIRVAFKTEYGIIHTLLTEDAITV